MSRHKFQRNKQLTPTEIYTAAIGIVEQEEDFILKKIIKDDLRAAYGVRELGRIYYSEEKKRYIVIAAVSTAGESIQEPTFLDARNKLTEALAEYKMDSETRVLRLSILAQNGRRKHYVLGIEDCRGGTSTIVQIEDSKSWSFGLGVFKKLYSSLYLSVAFINRGTQEFLDNWSCGHHVLVEIEREVRNEIPDSDYRIDADRLTKHSKYYDAGYKVIYPDDTQETVLEEEEEDFPELSSTLVSIPESTARRPYTKIILAILLSVTLGIAVGIAVYVGAPFVLPLLSFIAVSSMLASHITPVAIITGLVMGVLPLIGLGIGLGIQRCLGKRPDLTKTGYEPVHVDMTEQLFSVIDVNTVSETKGCFDWFLTRCHTKSRTETDEHSDSFLLEL